MTVRESDPPAGALPLEPTLLGLGARMKMGRRGVAEPADYGDRAAEYRALRTGCGVGDQSGHDLLEMGGEDRERFLNGMVTCRVRGLEAGEGSYGFLTDVKGKILSDVVILALEDRFRLELPPGRARIVREHLEKYVITDRVELRMLAGVRLLFAGAAVRGVVAALFEGPLPEALWGHGPVRLATGGQGRVAQVLWGSLPAVALRASPEAAARLLERAVAGPSLLPVGFEALEAVRIEDGTPLFGVDFGPDNLPQETGLDDAVSYEKGCYLGQEVVARIHFRGGVNRLPIGLLFSGDRPPPIGAEILADGREVGRVTSAALSPALARPVGLSLLHRRAADPGTVVDIAGGGRAEVAPLPLVSRAQGA